MNQIIYSVIITLSFLLCNDTEKYLFKNNVDLIQITDSESISEFTMGTNIGISTHSSRITHEFFPVTDNKNYKYKQVVSFSSVIATDRRNDKTRPDHEAQKLNGCIFTNYIDSTGISDYSEGNNDIAKEMIEEAGDRVGFMFGDGLEYNYLYPFGSDTLRAVGETWQIINENVATQEDRSGMDNFVGTTSVTTIYTFKKIKEKRGELIAYIDSDVIFNVRGISQSWEEDWEMDFSGEVHQEIRFNITKGVLVKERGVSSFRGNGKNLETEKTESFFISADNLNKSKYKNKK